MRMQTNGVWGGIAAGLPWLQPACVLFEEGGHLAEVHIHEQCISRQGQVVAGFPRNWEHTLPSLVGPRVWHVMGVCLEQCSTQGLGPRFSIKHWLMGPSHLLLHCATPARVHSMSWYLVSVHCKARYSC